MELCEIEMFKIRKILKRRQTCSLLLQCCSQVLESLQAIYTENLQHTPFNISAIIVPPGAHTHPHTHTYTHAGTHTHVHTYWHTHTHTHTHIHTQHTHTHTQHTHAHRQTREHSFKKASEEKPAPGEFSSFSEKATSFK